MKENPQRIQNITKHYNRGSIITHPPLPHKRPLNQPLKLQHLQHLLHPRITPLVLLLNPQNFIPHPRYLPRLNPAYERPLFVPGQFPRVAIEARFDGWPDLLNVVALVGEAVETALRGGIADVEGPGVGVVVFLGVVGAVVNGDFDGGEGWRGFGAPVEGEGHGLVIGMPDFDGGVWEGDGKVLRCAAGEELIYVVMGEAIG